MRLCLGVTEAVHSVTPPKCCSSEKSNIESCYIVMLVIYTQHLEERLLSASAAHVKLGMKFIG